MGKQELEKDRVTSLLQLDEWEDNQTAAIVATTVADSDSEEEDEENPDESFEEENKYREPRQSQYTMCKIRKTKALRRSERV